MKQEGQVRRVAGVELGGTKCVCVLGTPDGTIVDEVRIPTGEAAATLATIASTLDRWSAISGFERLGIASFGPLDLDRSSPTWGGILSTAKPGWSNVDVVGGISRNLDVPIAFDTDVIGAALAEGRWGAARGLSDFAYVTVGTGVGVGIIAGGKPLGGFGNAELGHVRVGRLSGDTWPGACPYHGDCVEGLASGSAVGARLGRPASEVDADDHVWKIVSAAIGGMLQTLVLTATPRLVLMGGGVLAGNEALLERIRTALADALGDYASTPLLRDLSAYVRFPDLGDRAGPLGALALALRAR